MKNTSFLPAVLLFLLSAVQACGQPAKPATHDFPENLRSRPDTLNSGSLANAGIDSSGILKLSRLIAEDSISNVHSLLIIRNDKLVYEQYFRGKDQRHGKKLGVIDHASGQLHDCRSISKSIVSACIGIALRQQLIKSIDEPVKNYFPEIKDSVKASVTIRQLLTMTSGFKWKEIGSYGSFFNSETQMDISFNPVGYVLSRNITAAPGTQWNYNGGNTQLLAEIIFRKSGMTIDKYAEKYLFGPLGITHYEWIGLTFKHIPAAASGLRLTPRDLMKFGLLYCHEGNWNGKQLVDSAWVRDSFKPFISRPDLSKYNLPDGAYGYQFWTFTCSLNGRTFDIAEAKGNGGQSVFFCKSLNLMVITTGGNYNKADNNPYVILTKYILPSVRTL